jgi:hypothetical protein
MAGGLPGVSGTRKAGMQLRSNSPTLNAAIAQGFGKA